MNKGFKTSETLLGIETPLAKGNVLQRVGFKTSETLLGIETIVRHRWECGQVEASKPLKPF